MQTAATRSSPTAPVSTAAIPASAAASAYQGYQIIRRNGAVVAFEPNKIAVALMKAFLAVHGTQGAASASVRETVPVEFERSIGNAAICAPEVGGQSRLVAPKNTFGDEPFTSQLWPLFTPESQVPPRTPSFGVASPTHFGHGVATVAPV